MGQVYDKTEYCENCNLITLTKSQDKFVFCVNFLTDCCIKSNKNDEQFNNRICDKCKVIIETQKCMLTTNPKK